MAKKRFRREHHSNSSDAALLADLMTLQHVSALNTLTALRIAQVWLESEPGRAALPYAIGFRDYCRQRAIAHAN